jgi:hypothetical protein
LPVDAGLRGDRTERRDNFISVRRKRLEILVLAAGMCDIFIALYYQYSYLL